MMIVIYGIVNRASVKFIHDECVEIYIFKGYVRVVLIYLYMHWLGFRVKKQNYTMIFHSLT